MKKNVFTAWMVATLLIGRVAYAQDNAQTGSANSVAVGAAQLGVGVSYRNFHSVRLKGISQNSLMVFGSEGTDPRNMMEWNSANVRNYVSGNPVPVPRGTGYMPVKAEIQYSDGFSLGGHGSWGTLESMAPVVSLGCDLYQNDSLTVGFISNLQFYNMDTATTAGGRSNNGYTVRTWIFWNDDSDGGWGRIRNDERMPGYYSENASALISTGRTKFDLQMWEIDLGLKAAYTMTSGLDLYLAAGPSLSYADMESSSGGRHDNDLDYIFGFYAAIGSSYWFNESYGLSFDVRYDEAFKHADTKYANMNLDSWSAMLKFLILF